MRFSLINVTKDNGDTVEGNWLQDVTGTVEDALHIAKETEKANSYKIKVAVVEEVSGTNPMLRYHTNLKKIVQEKNNE